MVVTCWITETARKRRWAQASSSLRLHSSSTSSTVRTRKAKRTPPRISYSLRIWCASNPCDQRSSPSSMALPVPRAAAPPVPLPLGGLVPGEPLRPAQLAQLDGLPRHRRVRRDLLRRVLQVVRDPVHQERDVVQELVGGEDAVGVDLHPRRDPLQPAARQVLARGAHPARERRRA